MKRTILFALLLLLPAQAQNVKKQNRLAKEKSPYLRQHGSNPVDWYPWGKEALDRAKKEGKPIFLSIGYSSCHWCHVMEHESFDDLEVAKMLNKYFVCIKVDREERPDIDAIYMKAVTEVMGVQGGWPLSVWLTSDAKPFFGRTYFPKKAFLEINQRIADVWADPKSRKDIEKDGDAVAARLKLVYSASEAGDLSPMLLKDARVAAEIASDREQGGWGGRAQAPKFPNPGAIELLLRYGMRHDDSGAIATANLVLTKMARGGIHDHVGGGFHRYSTTRDWLVPHFEKMLYDNAQLLPLYAWAYRVTGKEIYRETALDVARWVQREMTGEHGAFFSAQDADDPGGPEGEGGFYIWDPAEIRKLLGKDAAEEFLKNYDVTDKGNWTHRPGKSILQLRAGGKTIATSLATLYPVREKRPKPFTDTKVLAGWNGLMISGFCRSFQLLGEESHLESAVNAGNFIVEHMMADGKLRRRWADGSAGHDGVLDDYAWVVSAWLDLYESTFDEAWLSRAIALQQKADELFFDSAGGGYFYTPKDGEKLIARGKDAFDHARPAGNAVMAMNLLRLMHFTGNLSYKERANRTFKAFGDTAGRATFYFGALLNAVDFAADDTREIFIADGEGFDAMVEAVWRSPNRNRVLVKVTPAIQKVLDPAKGKDAVDGKAAAYVCRNFTCLAPVVDAALIDLTFPQEKKD